MDDNPAHGKHNPTAGLPREHIDRLVHPIARFMQIEAVVGGVPPPLFHSTNAQITNSPL